MPRFGYKQTKEHVENNSKSKIGIGHDQSDATKMKISIANKGHEPWNKGKMGVYSDDTIAKMSKSNTGKHRSDQTREKLSIVNTGKHHSDETKHKISESHRGKERTKEHRDNLSASLKGKPLTMETKRKLSIAGMGKHKGELSGTWKGGISFLPYCQKFNSEFKENVRMFFNYTCQMPECGHVWQPGERRLSVHHVNYDKMSCCNDVKPLFVAVCSGRCHNKTNIDREYWEKYFTCIINEKYNGMCYTKVNNNGY